MPVDDAEAASGLPVTQTAIEMDGMYTVTAAEEVEMRETGLIQVANQLPLLFLLALRCHQRSQ